MNVLVTGVTGRIGRGVADRLHSLGHVVIAGSSQPDRATGRPYPVHPVDLTAPDGLAELAGEADAVFLYPAPSAIDRVITALTAAAPTRVVLLSSASVLLEGADAIASGPRETEAALLASDLPVTVLRPDVFAGNSLDWLEEIRSGEVRLPYPDSHVAVVHEDDVVDAAVQLLTDPDLAPAAYPLTGPESLTMAEQVSIMASAVGLHPTVVRISPDAWRQSVPYLPDVVTDALLSIWRAADRSPRDVSHTVETITGRPARTFRSWVEEVVPPAIAAA